MLCATFAGLAGRRLATFWPSRRDRDRLYYGADIKSQVTDVIFSLGLRTMMGKRAVVFPCRSEIIPTRVHIARPPNPARHTHPDASHARQPPAQKTPGLSACTRGAIAPLLARSAASFALAILSPCLLTLPFGSRRSLRRCSTLKLAL